MGQRKIIKFIPVGIENQDKSDPSLFLKRFHETDLVFMDIGQGKRIHGAFFGVETYRQPLNSTDIVNGTLLVKIGECDMPLVLVDLNRRDRRRDLLNERKACFLIFVICPVNQFRQGRAPQSS